MVYDLSKEDQVIEFYNQTKEYEIAVFVNKAVLGNLQPIIK